MGRSSAAVPPRLRCMGPLWTFLLLFCGLIVVADGTLADVLPVAAVNNSNANKSTNSTVFCRDNSSACRQQQKDIRIKKEQIREEARSSVSDGTSLSDTSTTVKRDAVFTLGGVKVSWVEANTKQFKTAFVEDAVRNLGLIDNASVSVTGIMAGDPATGGSATNETRVILAVRGEANLVGLDRLTSEAQARSLAFTAVAKLLGPAVDPKLVIGFKLTDPKSALTTEAHKLNSANFKKIAANRPGASDLPRTSGMDTTVKTLLERAAKRDENDVARDVQDGRSTHERQVGILADELAQLVGAEVTKSTKWDAKNARAQTEALLGSEVKRGARDPAAQKRFAALGKELDSMLRSDL